MRAVVLRVPFSIALLATLAWRADAVQSVTLGWDPSPSPDVAGYNVHYGLESGNYIFKVSAGTNSYATILGLIEGETYYFAVTAYDCSAAESPPSNEVGYTVPGLAPPGQPWIQTDPANGGTILEWNPSPSPGVTGYNVYYSTASGSDRELVFSGDTTGFALSDLAPGTNGYFVVTAYDDDGQESISNTEVASTAAQANAVGIVPAPSLSLHQTPATGLPGVFSVTASGAIPPSWALEASSDLRTWGTLTTGSNSAVSVSVIISPKSRLFFRLESPLPGIHMQTRKPPEAFPNAFCIATVEAPPPTWTVQASEDLQVWNNLASGNGTDLNVAVVAADKSALYFRLKSR